MPVDNTLPHQAQDTYRKAFTEKQNKSLPTSGYTDTNR